MDKTLEMDDNAMDRLFCGDLHQLIELPKRLVRLFISSTFTDMTLERNSLMERVYPRLKKYCREKHGLDFQVVDMRWGVRDEATDDHQTSTLCSREIDNCQRMSLGPNFVALLGDKYGFRPLCNRIKSSEYRALRRSLIELDINIDFLDTWYREDLNAVPAEYLLQPISSILKNFTNKNEPELQAVDQRIWQAIQERLHELLMIGSRRLVQQGRMSQEEQLFKYSISVTEREVIEGCLDVKEAKSHCLIFVRSIQDLHTYLNKCLSSLSLVGNQSGSLQRLDSTSSVYSADSSGGRNSPNEQRRTSQTRKASLKIGEDSISLTTSLAQTSQERKVELGRKLIGKYIDLKSKENVWRVDEEAQAALAELKDVKLERKLKLSGKNLIKFKIMWSESDGVSLKSEEHKHYLNEMTEIFLNNMMRMIRKSSKSQQRLKSGLVGEILQHSHYAKHVSKSFTGRSNELDKIKAYLSSSSHEDCQAANLPMFIYGVVGSGKTSILAKAATLAKDWSSSANSFGSENSETWNRKPCIIMRFCCTTPSSSTMVGVLTSVCRQLQYNFYQFGPLNGQSSSSSSAEHSQIPFEPIPEDYVRLVFTFRQLLDNCQHPLHRQRLFVILLDSVERLSSPAESSVELKYSWLTSIARLPANVRLIISCSSESTSESWGKDYVHLKRHFLALYMTDQYLDQFEDSSGGQVMNATSGEEIPLHKHQKETIDEEPDRAEAPFARINQRYRYLKRILIPAVKFKRLIEKEAGASRPESVVEFAEQTGWSLRGKKDWPESDGGGLLSAELKHEPREQLEGPVWILHIRPLGVKLAVNVLQRWLGQVQRTLSSQQWSIVESSLKHCSRPIFVKLAFGEIVNWKSYSTQSDSKGLTFGSSLLNDDKSLSVLTGNSEFDDHLLKLMAESEASQKSAGLCFENQLLEMEQQWINFLEYKQRKLQQETMGAGSNELADNSSVVIRVGANSGGGISVGGGHKSALGAGGLLSGTICHLSSSIEDAICQLFVRIELQHGYVLTKHSLSYITAARNGICENELEDVLSLDDIVLDDVFQYHMPPVRRIPPLLWTRIRNDLPDYLSERDADGIVVNWHHGQFREVVQRRYLSERNQLFYIHSLLADYFLGKWADRPKPFRCTKQQIQLAADQLESAVQQSLRDSQALSGSSNPRASISGAGGRLVGGGSTSGGRMASFSVRSRLRSSDQHDARLQWMQAKADRRVPQQPLYYLDKKAASGPDSSGGGQRLEEEQAEEGAASLARRYNMRKLSELPHHLLRAGRFLDFAEHILFNYNWLSSALAAAGLQSLLADFREAIRVLEAALKGLRDRHEGAGSPRPQASGLVEQDGITCADELDEESLGAMVGQLRVLANTIRLSSSSIHSDIQMLAPQLIGRLLAIVSSARANPNPRSKQLTKYLGQLLDQCDRDGAADISLLPTDHCLQSPNGLQLSSLEGHSFAIMAMRMASDRRHLLAVSNRFIMWDVCTGEISRHVDPKIGASMMMELQIGLNNELAVAYTSDNLVLVLDILTQQVSRFQGLSLNKFSSQRLEQLRGLSLVDKLGASSFLVWSRLRWFALRVQKDEEARKWSRGSQSGELAKTNVQLVHSVELAELAGVSGEIIDVQQDGPLTFVQVSSEGDGCVQLLTVEFRKGQPRVWADRISCRALALHSANLNQALHADFAGRVYLSRRRQCSWSRPKLIWAPLQLGGDFLGQLGVTLAEDGSRDQFTGSTGSDVPLAIELDAERGHEESLRMAADGVAESQRRLDALAAFERRIDALEVDDEIKANSVFQSVKLEAPSCSEVRKKKSPLRIDSRAAVKFVRLYFGDRIEVVSVCGGSSGSDSSYKRRKLLFPRNIRNVSVERNRCQVSSILVQDSHRKQAFLVAAAARRLLIYDLESESCLRNIEAHQARIVQLIPLLAPDRSSSAAGEPAQIADEEERENDKEQLVFATGSMDKTAKIWNLLNVDKEVHSLDKMDGPIESICINKQRPLAACLARGQLGLWDWRRLKLITRISGADLIRSAEACEPAQRQAGADKILECRFSSNGRYLLLASSSDISLISIEQASSSRHSDTMADKLTFKQLFRRHLFPDSSSCRKEEPEEASVRRSAFFLQDSHLLLVAERAHTGSRRPSSYELASGEGLETRRLLLLCHSVPDGRLLYRLDCWTPVLSFGLPGGHPSGSAAQHLSARRRSSVGQESLLSAASFRSGSPARVRLPVLTRDHLHIVLVGCRARSKLPEEGKARADSLSEALTLNVYSSRDGLLIRAIDLSRLETFSGPVGSSQTFARPPLAGSGQESSPLLTIETNRASGEIPSHSASKASPAKSQANSQTISISGEQFSRLKAVNYRERQSVVALMDENKGASFLVDVKTQQLLAYSSAWNGKISPDGRYGLSWMFKSAATAFTGAGQVFGSLHRQPDVVVGGGGGAAAPGGLPSASDTFTSTATANNNNTSGLKLLEMRHFSPVKSLLTNETLSKLSSSSLSTSATSSQNGVGQLGSSTCLSASASARANETDVTCGFTRANDSSYVYYYHSRLSRLLLIRLHDGQLVANYKLSGALTKIKSSPDGLALILGQANGSLTSLAIVDPQKNDTLLRLAQYPSRRRS